MSKKFLFVLLVFAVIASPLFAATVSETAGTTTYKLDLSFIKNAVNLIVGIFAGGFVLAKAAMDIFGAVRHSDQDPNALKKAIGSLLLNVAILASFLFIVNYVFNGMVSTGAESGSASDFFSGLTGAFVSL